MMTQKNKLIWKNNRAFARYESWECYQAGFFNSCSCRDHVKVEESRLLLCNPDAFYAACFHVFEQWRITSLVHLTNTQINHKAWIGHAAAFLHHNACEDCTVKGWHLCDARQQIKANLIADTAVKEWIQTCEKENCQIQSIQLALTF